MTIRSAWLRSLCAIACWGGTICQAQDADLKVDPVLADEAVELVVETAPADAEAPQKVVLPNRNVVGAGGGAFAFTPDGLLVSSVPISAGAGEVNPGRYWIGLLCVDPGEPLRAQLGLESGAGLLVEAVTDDSPAKKAGIQPHDVLITARLTSEKSDDAAKKLTQVKELVEVVQAAETKPLHLVIVRKGQKQAIEVAPAERPKVNVYAAPDAKEIHGFIDANVQSHGDVVRTLTGRLHEPQLGMRLAGPMFTVELKAPPLPEGMTMEFHQVVGQPEKVTVKKGADMWGATEKELDTLPEDIRVLVLQQMAARRGGHLSHAMAMPQPHMQPPVGMPGMAASKDGRVMAWAGPAGQYVVVSAATANLPDDVTVTVVRKGSEPAKITARKGEQTWDITEKELDKLPEELRKHVDAVLKGPAPASRNVTGAVAMRRTPMTVSVPATSANVVWSTRRAQDQAAAQQQSAEAQRDEQLRRVQTELEQKAKQLQQIKEQNEIYKQLKELNEKVEKLQQALEKTTEKK